MTTFSGLCLTTALCTLLTQCAVQPVAPLIKPTNEGYTETTTHFAGKTYVRRETDMIDSTGDTQIKITER